MIHWYYKQVPLVMLMLIAAGPRINVLDQDRVVVEQERIKKLLFSLNYFTYQIPSYNTDNNYKSSQ